MPLIVVVAPGEPGVPVVWISVRAEGAIAITAIVSTLPKNICRAAFIGVGGGLLLRVTEVGERNFASSAVTCL